VTAWRLTKFETLPSTSDYCVSRAKEGQPAGLAVLARRQTAGRGSRGREWQAPEGNLNLSVLVRPARPAAESGIFALLAGLAVAQAVAGFLPAGPAPLLKWPNDVLLTDAKLAGVLIDAAPAGPAIDWLVIGIGINLCAAPEIPGRAVTTLLAHGADISADQAADAVLQSLSRWLDALAQTGPAAIRDAWLARAHAIGTPVTIRAVHGSKTGSFAGLSPHGALLLARDNQIERIDTGEILLERAGS